MRHDAWRLYRPVLTVISGLGTTLFDVTQAASVQEVIGTHQRAYAAGTDLILLPQPPLDAASIATALDLQSVTTAGTLSGSGPFATNATVIRRACAQGRQTASDIQLGNIWAACSPFLPAAMIFALNGAGRHPGRAFPCHEFARTQETTVVRNSHFIVSENGTVQSMTEIMIGGGIASSAQDNGDFGVFADYARAKDGASRAKAGIWQNQSIQYPYGERYRSQHFTV